MSTPTPKYPLALTFVLILQCAAFSQSSENSRPEIVHFVSSSEPMDDSEIYFNRVSNLVQSKILKSLKATPDIKGKEAVLFISLANNKLENCRVVKGINSKLNQKIKTIVESIDFSELEAKRNPSNNDFLIPIKFGNTSK
ncbi:hypothetical protein [Luteibaculum oceani]|uniref:TonB C-terminal domain-containing protein n=1 Tax=Luteibaculum oceani TaxID=1294296 RepID=A0A5C6V1P3_9FLAO|nr:hypothetical protein [Luteibaculum oceani]TXC76905.1 hypothetical protein FRX97_09825 [Luteibaculum oceani]